ncbi:DUF1800 domain-containing protein [Lacibacter sediminis]|uniref:DUF1800 domain-containing protein n=1 Tax=Lacibacter sediminis TaxID=2760713 RepID=A0A7G5XEV3_9BACT|nr:DUF1800 domain-containing protein [Lacibacter sediminis]QNA44006.1 DUF1800 domain-containing protein [Lacibacter sediminis]
MDRREFLTAGKRSGTAVHSISKTSARTYSGLNAYNGQWTKNEVVHLLKRCMFGATLADINYFAGKTMNEAVDELLNPTAPLPAPPVKDYDGVTGATTPDNDVVAGETWVNSVNNDGTIQSRRRAAFKKWWMGCIIQQDRSIREKMLLFWHNHFATETVDVGNANFLYKHVNLLRTKSLGNFKQLVRDITLDPAMLIYLNGRLNTATAPDENYARELQELFTLGKENNPNYTEADVKAAAKVLTGWRADSNVNTFPSYFTSSRHDSTNKTFSSFFSNTVITGRTGTTAGDLELDDLLNMIFARNMEVSRFMAKKLYRFFVYSEIDAAAEANVIEPLAQILRNNNWEIKPALSALLKSEHFFDVLNQGAMLKSPLEHAGAICREWGVLFPNAVTEYADAYGMWNYVMTVAANYQQNLGDPPSVAGWPAYYQVPQFYELWINTDTLPKRNQFSDLMIGNGYTRNGKKIVIDAVAFTKTLSNPADPNMLINELFEMLFRIPISQQAKDQLKKDFLLTGQDQDYYWSNAWNIYIGSPITTNFNIVNTRLRGLFKYCMNLAEYQLM